MSYEKKKVILDKIKEYEKIIIFRHFRPDGDAIGSTKGLKRILELSYPKKKIYLSNADYSDYMSFLGGDDGEFEDEFYADALGIVIDTATKERISSKKFELCRELVKIDHHINVQSYANYEWVEEEKCAACEMIAEFYDTFRNELKLDSVGATYIYAGLVTDSGRFRFRSVSGDSMRYAGLLLDIGVDLDTLYANLYMKEFNTFKFESFVYNKMKITENGVAYFHVTKAIRDKFGLSMEDASASVSYMDSIKNSLIWIAFIDSDDGNIRVRLRSRFVTVNSLAEKYGGGGHACACGATVKSTAEMRKLLKDANELLGKFKSENEGWL